MVARKREESRYGARGGNYGGRPSSGAVGPGGSGGGRRSLMQDSGSAQQQGNPDGWKTVPSRRVDPRTLTLDKDKDVDGEVKLGPVSGLSKWTQGCRTKGKDGDRISATKNMGRQNLSPSPRNSANSSRRGSNSNIPATVAAYASASQRDQSAQNREEHDSSRNGVPGTVESVGASSADISERPPPDSKLRKLVENKCKHICSEYSGHKEFDFNAFEPIKLYGDVFVESLIGYVIELTKVARIEAGHMMLMMLHRGYIRIEDISDGFKPTFEAAADILMDVPKFYTYVAEILSGMVCDDVMCALPKIMEPLNKCPEVSTVIAEMLHLASGENGHDKIGVMFRSASLDWHIFLHESIKMDDFIKRNKLEFTLTGGVPKVPDCCVNLDDLETQLRDLVSQHDLNKEDVFSLIETNVDKRTASSKEFVDMVVRTITGVAVKSSDFDLLQNLCPVLRHVIGNCADKVKVQELMLQALYAIQKLALELHNPSQSINAVFDVLCDNGVINDQAFLDYYNLKHPEVIEGYDLTIKSTANFYATLMST